MNNFFITGFPRSRTAWLANLLTYRNSYCYHELCKYGKSVYELASKLQKRNENFVGTADCGFPFYYKDMMELLPGSKIIVIERNVDDVKQSLKNFFGEWSNALEDTITKTNANLNEMTDNFECKFIDYNNLDKMTTIKDLVNYVTDGKDWDLERFIQLEETNVSLIKSKYLSNVNVKNVSTLLGV